MNHDIGYRVSMVEDFFGEFERSIDPKGRITLPSGYRGIILERLRLHNYKDSLADSVRIVPLTNHIKIYDALGYERKREEIKCIAKIIYRKPIDSQGRILILENFRGIFGDSGKVLITPSEDLDSIMVNPFNK